MRSAHDSPRRSQDDKRRAPAVADAGWSERTLLSGTPKPAVSPRSASPAPAAPRSGSGRPRSVPFAVLLVGVIAAAMCALLALNTATAASEVRQRRVDAANASLSARQEQLSRSVAEMQAPAELSRLAARLGLVPAGSAAFLRINADGTVTVLGAPTKVPAPVIPLTRAQHAAAKAALSKAAAAKAAQAKAAKEAQAKAAKAAKAKAAASTKTKPSGATSPTATSTGTTPPKAPATKTTSAKTTAPRTKSPKTTSPKTTSPKTTSAKTVSPTPTVTKPSPVPTVTVPGGPR